LRLSPLDPQRWHFYGALATAHLVAGRPEEAVKWVDLALHEQPHSRAIMELKAAACALFGRIEEAREWVGRLREFRAGWSIERFTRSMGRRQSPEVLAVFIDGLRKAGLPEE
jgi:adenylate cyclase